MNNDSTRTGIDWLDVPKINGLIDNSEAMKMALDANHAALIAQEIIDIAETAAQIALSHGVREDFLPTQRDFTKEEATVYNDYIETYFTPSGSEGQYSVCPMCKNNHEPHCPDTSNLSQT